MARMYSEDEVGHLWRLVQSWLDSEGEELTRRQLAKRLGVSPYTLANWEYGISSPSPRNLHRLSKQTGINYEQLVDAMLHDRGYKGATETDMARTPRKGNSRVDAPLRDSVGDY